MTDNKLYTRCTCAQLRCVGKYARDAQEFWTAGELVRREDTKISCYSGLHGSINLSPGLRTSCQPNVNSSASWKCSLSRPQRKVPGRTRPEKKKREKKKKRGERLVRRSLTRGLAKAALGHSMSKHPIVHRCLTKTKLHLSSETS